MRFCSDRRTNAFLAFIQRATRDDQRSLSVLHASSFDAVRRCIESASVQAIASSDASRFLESDAYAVFDGLSGPMLGECVSCVLRGTWKILVNPAVACPCCLSSTCLIGSTLTLQSIPQHAVLSLNSVSVPRSARRQASPELSATEACGRDHCHQQRLAKHRVPLEVEHREPGTFCSVAILLSPQQQWTTPVIRKLIVHIPDAT